MRKMMKSKAGRGDMGMGVAFALVAVVVGLIIATSILGATIGLMFNGLSDVANNITAEGGEVGGFAIFFSVILPLVLVIGLFLALWRLIQKA